MPKITRQTFLQFGINVNASADICQFGSPATGSPVYTNVIATLQALAAWGTGWAAETIANNRPFLEDMNAVCYVFSYMIAYILQMGVAEWDAGTTYYINSFAQSGGIVYQSLTDNNLNNSPTVGVNWKIFSQVSGVIGVPVAKSAGTIYQAATDGYAIGYGSCGGGAEMGLSIGATTPPGNLIAYLQTATVGGQVIYDTLCTLVPKGNYYSFGTAGGLWTSIFFIPIGS